MTDLQRFHDAQEGSYEQALAELRRGRKTSHWMWWIFPQVAGLGSSPTSQLFAIADPAEPVFQQVLDAFFDGERDPRTEAFLGE
ncbi:hypothetical protein JCM18899A_30520 [Nocardioides sp. AN3]